MLPTKNYNKLYDNEAYNNLSKAIADHLGVLEYCPTQEYLDIMVEIQDKAISYSNLVYFNSSRKTLAISYIGSVRPFYYAFMQPYITFYHNKGF